jgi:hypothetical protein
VVLANNLWGCMDTFYEDRGYNVQSDVCAYLKMAPPKNNFNRESVHNHHIQGYPIFRQNHEVLGLKFVGTI